MAPNIKAKVIEPNMISDSKEHLDALGEKMVHYFRQNLHQNLSKNALYAIKKFKDLSRSLFSYF